MPNHGGNVHQVPAASTMERPSWIEWTLALTTMVIFVGALFAIATAIGTLLVSVYVGDVMGVVAVPGMLVGGVVGLAYAAFVGIGWEVLRRLREISGRLADSRSLLAQTRTMVADHLAMGELGEAAASESQMPAECDLEQDGVLQTAGGSGAPPAATRSHVHPSMSLLHEAVAWKQETRPAGPVADSDGGHVPASSEGLYRVEYRRKDGTLGRQEVRASSAHAVRRAIERRGHEVLRVDAQPIQPGDRHS